MIKIRRMLILFIVNNFLCFTRFFFIKRKLLKWAGIKIGKNTKIVCPIYIGNMTELDIGDECWIGKDLNVEGNGSVTIESNCDFAPHVTLLTGSHKIGGIDRRAGDGISGRIFVGAGSWIGSRAIILPDVLIGSGSVIATGAVVVHDVESNTLAGGVPAKKIKDL